MSEPAKKRQRFFPVYPQQAAFLDATEPIKGFVGGQGSGKSKVGAYDLLQRAKAGRLYMVVAPTYPMLRDATFRTFRELAQNLGQWADLHRAEFTARIRTRDRGIAEILFRSGDDPDRLRGPNLSGAWADEASLLKHEAFQILTARLREGGEQGWLDCTFTPKGFSHWSYEVFGKAKPGVFLIHASTRDNPFLPSEFLHTVAQQFSGLRADQELGGRFVNVEGAEWPGEYFPESIWFDQWPENIVVRVVALDPSKGRRDKPGDYSAFALLALDQAGTLWIDADLDQVRDHVRIVEDGIRHWRAFNPQAVVIETNNFQELLAAEFLRVARAKKTVLPVWQIVNSAPKDVRIRSIGPFLAQGKIRFNRDSKGAKLLVQQLRDFPMGEHDDGPDALEMAIRMAFHLLGRRGTRDQPRLLRA